MPLIDVGSGSSILIDSCLSQGFQDITALDISASAFTHSKNRLAAAAARVRFVEADILGWQPTRYYGLWHDRAAFHFLIEPTARGRYFSTLTAVLEKGGYFICATFAFTGPKQCSGLTVRRYDAEVLGATFAPWFDLLENDQQVHLTPGGSDQRFIWELFRRK